MAFCTECGHQLAEGAKFCFECGAKVNAPSSPRVEQRKTVYDGEIHKCPNCGEVLNSFISTCPACGHELRNTRVSTSVKEFAEKVIKAETEAQKTALIRNFPIPNAKEDIIEFIILASSNINGDSVCESAWVAKLEQVYHKAQITLHDSSELEYIKHLYNDSLEKRRKRMKAESTKQVAQEMVSGGKKVTTGVFKGLGQIFVGIGRFIKYFGPILPRTAIAVGWIIAILVIIPRCQDMDYQMMLLGVLIAGACFIPHVIKCDSAIPSAVTTIGLMISIYLLIVRCKNSIDYQMMLIATLISTGFILTKVFRKKE